MGLIVFIAILVGGIFIFRSLKEKHEDLTLLRTVTDTHRGTQSERSLIKTLLKFDIPASTLFHDLYIERYNGQYSQIDAVAVTPVGIIVFEVKEYSGWIFGNGYQNQWTQVLAYGKDKNRFYSPVLQNQGHIDALKNRLGGLADVPYYSVIVFYGNCQLKKISNIPYNTYITYAHNVRSIVSDILQYNRPAYYYDENGVLSALQDAATNGGDSRIVSQHIRNVRNYINTNR